MEVPANNVSSKTTFYIETELLLNNNKNLVLPNVQLINSSFYDVFVKDENDNFVHQFSLPIIITLPVSVDLQKARELGVYWLNEINNQWVLIPDAVFTNNHAVFRVNHLTKFAIFVVIDLVDNQSGTQSSGLIIKPSLPLPNQDKIDTNNIIINTEKKIANNYSLGEKIKNF
mgnify:CR=1 FL=1